MFLGGRREVRRANPIDNSKKRAWVALAGVVEVRVGGVPSRYLVYEMRYMTEGRAGGGG
jgi:hypothetical protein